MPEWPADAVEHRATNALLPSAGNARTHSAAQIKEIAAAIAEWGWTIPILIDGENRIIAGHGRVLAAKRLGIIEIPVIVARGWTEAQCRAYALADNKLALNADWDSFLLKAEIADLHKMGIDLSLSGFSAGELAELLPALPAERVSAEDSPPPREITGGCAGGGYREQYGVIVVCRDEAHQRETFERLSALGYEPRVVVT